MTRPRAAAVAAAVVAAVVVAAVVAAVAPGREAAAESVKAGDLVIHDPWARASAGRARAGAAYVTIHNHGAADWLIGATADVAERIEPHAHAMTDGVMRMHRLEAIGIDEGARIALKPGGVHLMLTGLKAPLVEGGSFPLALRFRRAGEVTVRVTVLGVGAMGPKTKDRGAHHGEGAKGPDPGKPHHPPARK